MFTFCFSLFKELPHSSIISIIFLRVSLREQRFARISLSPSAFAARKQRQRVAEAEL